MPEVPLEIFLCANINQRSFSPPSQGACHAFNAMKWWPFWSKERYRNLLSDAKKESVFKLRTFQQYCKYKTGMKQVLTRVQSRLTSVTKDCQANDTARVTLAMWPDSNVLDPFALLFAQIKCMGLSCQTCTEVWNLGSFYLVWFLLLSRGGRMPHNMI